MSEVSGIVFAALTKGATVITANRRLARAVIDDYNRAQAAAHALWETPRVLPWASWLQQAWELLGEVPRESRGEETGEVPDGDWAQDAHRPLLLAPFQELTLWEQVVRDSAWGGGLLQPAPAARAAREAWELVHAWRLDLARLETQRDAWGEDTRAFVDWARSYRRRCAQGGWLDQARLADWVGARLGGDDAPRCAAALALPARIVLAGFDELTPQQAALVEVLRDADVNVETASSSEVSDMTTGGLQVVALADAEAELMAAARWARRCMTDDPQLRIGVVIPELTTLRAVVERIFDDVLLPGAVLPGGRSPEALWQARPYKLSAGRPLSEYPVVEAAFQILRLGAEPQPVARVGALLRSSFIGGAQSEREARAAFDARLRRRGEMTIGVRGLLALLQPEAGREPGAGFECALLRDRLGAWDQAWRELPRRQAPSRWAEEVPRLLAALGWPGERGLDSLEYQTVQAFRAQLAALAGLDTLQSDLSLPQVVSALQRLCSAQLFQPEGGDAPIQILGALEASGLRFERLWVMGLHDEVWPQAPRPNPLLPVRLQREAGMPHASPERELMFATRVTQRLCAAAPEVMLSWPRRDGDRDLRPSPILTASISGTLAGEHGAVADGAAPLYRETLIGTAALDTLDDAHAPAVSGERPAGGTAIFKHQAACPFRAFAEHRLGARPLEEVQIGLDARGRGIVLHTALEYLWAALRDYAHLAALSQAERRAQVDAAVQRAVEAMAARYPGTFTPRFRVLEEQRLGDLLEAWLACELARAPFSVVRQEQEEDITLGGVTARLKIDRIDRLENGALAIIDYKSGRTDVRDWLDDRPEEPQLPMYALSQEGQGEQAVAAVAFAQLRPGKLRFAGLAREAELVPGTETLAAKRYAGEFADWPALLAHWRATLSGLGEAFRAGAAAVDPKHYPQTCRYCHLTALCRVGEQHAFGPNETDVGETDITGASIAGEEATGDSGD
ncbi:MAG: PD-(D/E)XK nuclease family protein [Pseudolabrys sp.]